MAELLHQCLTKATTAEGDDIRRSLNWVLSRRAMLSVYTDRLTCGDWVISYTQVDEAVLFYIRQLFIPCYVLRVKAHGRIYQFGLNPGRFWQGELPLSVRREAAPLKYSWFSIALRAVILAGLAYLLWRSLR